jgi:hypothetical protein
VRRHDRQIPGLQGLRRHRQRGGVWL